MVYLLNFCVIILFCTREPCYETTKHHVYVRIYLYLSFCKSRHLLSVAVFSTCQCQYFRFRFIQGLFIQCIMLISLKVEEERKVILPWTILAISDSQSFQSLFAGLDGVGRGEYQYSDV